MGKQEEFKAVD
jgi:hypothetical protein